MKGHKMNIQKISNRAIKSPASRKLSLNLTDLSPRSSNGTPLTSPKRKFDSFPHDHLIQFQNHII